MARRIVLVGVIFLMWTWAGAADRAIGQETRAEKLVRITYPVADLIQPIRDHTAFSERQLVRPVREISADEAGEMLMKLIGTLARDTWQSAGGQGRIQFFPLGQAIVVEQREEVHRNIARLLAALRRAREVQVSIETRLVAVAPKTADRLRKDLQKIGQPVQAFQDEEGKEEKAANGVVSIDERRLSLLLEAVQSDRSGHIVQMPKLTVFDGQRVGLSGVTISPLGVIGPRADLRPVVDGQRKTVRLHIDLEVANKIAEADGLLRRDIVNAVGTFAVPTGRTIVWHLGQTHDRLHLFVLATPRVHIVSEEPDVLLSRAGSSSRGGAEEQAAPEPKKADKHAIERRLREPIALNMKDVPLKQAIKDLAISTGLQIIPDELWLRKARINMEMPVSINVEDIEMRFALNILLRPLGLRHIIEDDVLKITTEERVHPPFRKSYPIGDLVANMAIVPVLDGNKGDPASSLVQLIKNTIAKEKWEEMGGAGSIQYFPLEKKLVVTQPGEIHEEIDTLLVCLRKLYDVGVDAEMRFVQVSPATARRLLADMAKAAPAQRGLALPFAVVDEKQSAALLETAQADASATIGQGPKLRLLSGQRIGFDGQTKETLRLLTPGDDDAVVQKNETVRNGWRLEMQTIVSPDRRRVRTELNYRLAVHEGERTTTTGSQVNVSLESGRTLVWHLGVQPTSRQHLFVLITSRVAVRETPEPAVIEESSAR